MASAKEVHGPACDVSVVLVNWNGRDFLRDCLRSVRERTRGLRYELLVVDNASSDGSREMVRREFPTVRLLVSESNLGYARACNAGMRAARGRYVLTLNTDTVLLDDAIGGLAALLDARPDAGATGCTLVWPDGRLQPACARFPTLPVMLIDGAGLLFGLQRLLHRTGWFWGPYYSPAAHRRARDVDWVHGACLMVRREVLDEVGFLDEGRFMYTEEIDWCRRIKNAGWRVVYTPAVRVRHLGGGSTRMSEGRRTRVLVEGIRHYYRRHCGPLRCVALDAMLAAGYACRWVCFPILGLVSRMAEAFERRACRRVR